MILFSSPTHPIRHAMLKPFPRSRLALGILIALQPLLARSQQHEENTSPTPVLLEAQKIVYTPDQANAQGDVHIQYQDWNAHTPALLYQFSTSQVKAPEAITLEKPGIRIDGRCADISLKTQTGTIQSPRLRLENATTPPSFRYLSAEEIELQGRDKTHLSKVRYSGCDGETPDWWLQSQSIDLNQNTGIGEAHHATLYFKGVPLFYTPWMDFPLKGQRKSGLLPPTIGTSGERGFEFQQPIYVNLASNYDATITPRWMGKRGLQLGGQFRYLGEHSSTEVNGEWLNDDHQTQTNRYFAGLKHENHFNSGAAIRLNLNTVSDARYFTDLSERISATSQGALPREVEANYPFQFNTGSLQTEGTANLRLQRFQPLQTLPSDLPFERVPQLTLNTSTPLREPATSMTEGLPLLTQSRLAFNTYTDIAKFRQATQNDVDRTIVYPQLAYSYRTPALSVKGHLGLNGRFYHYSDNTNTSAETINTTIWTPISSIDTKLFLDPDTPGTYRPHLEARAFYVYIPYRYQAAHLPVIDSAAYSSEESGLFSENDFTGFDRINDANRMTLALNAHWKHPTRDTERLSLGIAQRISFQTPHISPGDLKTRSPLFVYGRGEMGKGFNWSVSTSYDLDRHQTQHAQAGVQYRPTDDSLVQATYRFQRDTPLSSQIEETWRQVDLSGQWTLSSQWKGLWRWNYDLKKGKLLEALGGVEYTKGCWGIRAVGQHLVTSETTSTKAFFLQLELDGLGQLGSNPMDVLRRSIPGYVENRPAALMVR